MTNAVKQLVGSAVTPCDKWTGMEHVARFLNAVVQPDVGFTVFGTLFINYICY
jgi:hypothetical protein